MSKMDNLRAMREARYDQAVARGAQHGGSTPSAASRAPRPAAVPAPPVPATRSASAAPTPPERAPVLAVVPDQPEPEPEPEEALCGHRNMSGRTCTREAGHSAKSHRYS